MSRGNFKFNMSKTEIITILTKITPILDSFSQWLFSPTRFYLPKLEIWKSAYLEIRYFYNVYLYIWSVTKSYQIFCLNL